MNQIAISRLFYTTLNSRLALSVFSEVYRHGPNKPMAMTKRYWSRTLDWRLTNLWLILVCQAALNLLIHPISWCR